MPVIPYPPAYMGFVGFVKFITTNPSNVFTVRASSADVKLTQTVDKPDLISGKYDRTVYKLGPKEVGGGVSFPAIMENATDASSGTTAAVPALWRKAILRIAGGRLDQMDLAVKYTSDNAFFKFTNCIVNSFEFSVTQGDLVNINLDLMGVQRIALVPINSIGNGLTEEPRYNTRNARAVTWNDSLIQITNDDGILGTSGSITGEWLRAFTATVNNNAERFYTLNGKLFPQDVQAKQRDISGTMTVMGRNPVLGLVSETNQDRCNEVSNIKFGYQLTIGCQACFLVELPGCVFQIEEMSLTNDLLESTVNWHSLPGGKYTDALGHETFEVCTSS